VSGLVDLSKQSSQNTTSQPETGRSSTTVQVAHRDSSRSTRFALSCRDAGRFADWAAHQLTSTPPIAQSSRDAMRLGRSRPRSLFACVCSWRP